MLSPKGFLQICQSAFACCEHYWVKNDINPLMLTEAKTAWQFWWNLWGKSMFGKIFEGVMFIKALPTTLLQIFCKIILNS